MKVNQKINGSIFVIGLALMSSAQAGPTVNITFKNNGSSIAEYDVIGSSAYSYSEANPKPPEGVAPGTSSRFAVLGRLSPDVTTAIFQYRMGTKFCRFQTSYVKLPGRGGAAPKWTKSAKAEGGAWCDIRVVSTDMRTHNWSVEFIMR